MDEFARHVRQIEEEGAAGRRIQADVKAQIIATGHPAAKSESYAEMAGLVFTAQLATDARAAGVSLGEWARRRNVRFMYDKGTGDLTAVGREVYRSPLNADVDLNAEMDDIVVSGTLPLLDDAEAWRYSKDEGVAAQVREIMDRAVESFDGGVRNKHRPEMRLSLSMGGMDHIWHTAQGTRGEDGRVLKRAVEHLKEIAENAYLVETHKDKYKKEGYTPQGGEVRQVHRFIAPVLHTEKDAQGQDIASKYILVLTVKEMENGTQEIGHLGFYDQKVGKKMEMPAQSHPQDHETTDVARPIGAVTATFAGKTKIADAVRGVKDAEGKPYLDDGQRYEQIGARRKGEMDAALAKRRPDMTPEQRAEAVAEIEKLGEEVKGGGSPKVEKAATKWLLDGHIILPEDGYKILDALKICEQQGLDPMSFDDPNTILAKYTIKESAAGRRRSSRRS